MIGKLVAGFLISVTAFAAGTLGFWFIDREPPVVTLKWEALNDPVYPGGDLRVRYTVYRSRSCEARIDRFLYDADNQRVILDEIVFIGAPGPLGESSYVSAIPIPRKFAEGPARYWSNIAYECNPLHAFWPIPLRTPEVQFRVSGAPELPIETVPRR